MLSTEELRLIKKIKKRQLINIFCTRVGYGCLVLAFMAHAYADAFTFYLLTGALILLAGNLCPFDAKLLLFLLEKYVSLDASSILKKAEISEKGQA